MGKKKNVLKRNSGFIAGCVLAAGASFFTADFVMTNGLPVLAPATSEGGSGTETKETIAPEKSETRVYETDPFTVTASGNIIKGVETEKQTEEKDAQAETDEQGNPVNTDEAGGNSDEGTGDWSGDTGSDGNGSWDGSSDDSGSWDGSSDGSGSWDGSSDGSGSWDGSSGSNGSWDGNSGQSIEIQDPGNGDYTYGDGSGSGSGSTGSSGSSDGSDSGSSDGSGSSGDAQTPSDVIIWGISSRYIDESELYNYDAGQLRLIRNEIFALNGRIFKSQDLRDYFSQKSWYVPTYAPEDFDANMFDYLNDYEEANLEVILNYEAALAGN